MKTFVFGVLTLLFLNGCNAQDNRNQKPEDSEKHGDSIAKVEPQVRWKVNKKVDEQGNVIGYDSIYSWSYSNRNGIPPEADLDSLMQAFGSFSGHGITPFREDDEFGFFPEPDSLWSHGNFFDKFLLDRQGPNYETMKKLMQDMDSLQQLFMERHRMMMTPQEEEKNKI